jgi:two-component system, sensor histidine kinase and response regulator
MAATILLVDSDLIDRADWQALLQFHGYKVHTAPNGKAALDCFPSVHPDLVLMDSTLTDFSSDEVCSRLKADPRSGDTPIIVVGSHLSRLKRWDRSDENPRDSSSSPATRAQALDRIHALLSGGQFNLFSELRENVEDRRECEARGDVDSAMQIEG